MWQELVVAAIVGGAVVYLLRKFGIGRRKPKPPATFVPVSDLKRRR
jgi:hypothetical protein